MISLLWNHIKLAAWIVGIVLGLALYHEHNLRIAEAALAQRELSELKARDRMLSDSVKEKQKVFVRDTLKLTKVVREFKTIHDSAEKHITDTVLVKAALDQADTTIRACRLTVQDCANLNHTLTIELGVKDSLITTYKKLLPSTTAKVVNAAKFTLMGAAVGYFLVHFGVVK